MQDLLQCAVRIAEGSSGFGLEQRRWEALQQLRGAVKKRRGAAWRFFRENGGWNGGFSMI
jgi:hypothetical protein